MFYNILKVAAVSMLLSGVVLAGCGESGKNDQSIRQTGHEGMQGGEMMHSQDEESSTHDMEGTEQGGSGQMQMGGTMDKVFTADKLYTCPMHSEVVTADGEQNCPLCHMKLTALPDEKVTELGSSHPRGCPMDPIVVKGDSETDTCPVCNMKLQQIKEGEQPKRDPGKMGM